MMQQNAPQLVDRVHQEIATVRAVVGPKVTVETRSGAFECRRAASCALVPAPGDVVLLAVPQSGYLYVLAVLSRHDEDAPQRWRVEPGLKVESEGEVSIFGLDGVAVTSPERIEMTTKQLEVSAVDASIQADRLGVSGRFIQTYAGAVKGVLGALDTVIDRVSSRVKESYRYVDELDLTRAKQIDTRAENTMTLRAKNAFVAAKDLVKVDGEQIHLG